MLYLFRFAYKLSVIKMKLRIYFLGVIFAYCANVLMAQTQFPADGILVYDREYDATLTSIGLANIPMDSLHFTAKGGRVAKKDDATIELTAQQNPCVLIIEKEQKGKLVKVKEISFKVVPQLRLKLMADGSELTNEGTITAKSLVTVEVSGDPAGGMDVSNFKYDITTATVTGHFTGNQDTKKLARLQSGQLAIAEIPMEKLGAIPGSKFVLEIKQVVITLPDGSTTRVNFNYDEMKRTFYTVRN